MGASALRLPQSSPIQVLFRQASTGLAGLERQAGRRSEARMLMLRWAAGVRAQWSDVMASQAGEMNVRLLVSWLGRQDIRCAQCAASSSAWLPVLPGTLQLANRVLMQRLLLCGTSLCRRRADAGCACFAGRRTVVCAGLFTIFGQTQLTDCLHIHCVFVRGCPRVLVPMNEGPTLREINDAVRRVC